MSASNKIWWGLALTKGVGPMPSANAELQQRMFDRFGSHTDDEGPIKFLEAAGYKLTREWEWVPKQGVTCLKDMTREEFDCLLFLAHEWDFGGLIEGDRGMGDA